MRSKIKAGDMVEILSMHQLLHDDGDYEVGEICEVKEVNENGLRIYTADKSDWWFFDIEQVRKVRNSKNED